jgi:hypothetical protein
MYSTYARRLSFAIEETAETITEEEELFLRQKYQGISLQKILYDSAPAEILDYISHTRKQRETLKKYGPAEKRAELKFRSFLYLQACLNMIQALQTHLLTDVSGEDMLEAVFAAHHLTAHPKLYSPSDYRKEEAGKIFGFPGT